MREKKRFCRGCFSVSGVVLSSCEVCLVFRSWLLVVSFDAGVVFGDLEAIGVSFWRR